MAGTLRAIVFDYGQVLSRREDPARSRRMAAIAGLDPRLLRRMYQRLRPAYDRGEIDGAAYWRRIAASAGRALADEQVGSLVGEDTRNTAELDPGMLGWAGRIAEAGLVVGILSNMTPDDMELIGRLRIRERLGSFAVQLFSSEIGMVKPEPAIYRRCLADLGVEPGQVLFIDDKAENVRGARRAGMRAARFRSFEESVPALVHRYRLPPAIILR